MIKNFLFKLDIEKEYNNRMHTVNSNDLQTVKFTFIITDNGIPLDLTGLTVRIAIRKPDKKAVWQDCTITNASRGEAEVILDNQAYVKKGEHEAEVMLYKGTDTVAITQKFYYRASLGIMSDNSLKSETVLGPIDLKLAEVEETLKDIRENGTGIDAQARQDIEGVTAQLADTLKKEIVDTTAGIWWSDSIENLSTLIDDEKYNVKITPSTHKKRIVLLGSSSVQGVGPSNLNMSYGMLLKERLQSKGYEVINRGISGDNTGGAVARFYRDVAPLNPDFVILAFTLGNENFVASTNKPATYKFFRDRLLKLAYMCKQIGALPIVMNQAPTGAYTTEFYNYAKKHTEEFENMGFYLLDWNGVIDDLSGMPINGVSPDGIHYNDATHIEICNAIPPTLFERIGIQNTGILKNTYNEHMRFNNLTSSTPLFYTVPTDEPISTFTAFVRFKRDVGEKVIAVLMSLNPIDRVYLSGTNGSMIFNQNGTETPISNIDFSDGNWHSLGVTYNNLAKVIRIYVDGVFKVEIPSSLPFSKWIIGGREGSPSNLKNTEIKDAILYRTRFSDERMSMLHRGYVPQSSLEVYSPLHDNVIFPNVNLVNLAPTTAQLKIGLDETNITQVIS